MSGATLGFFIAGLLVAFGFALAVQMRVLAGVALKRAARAKFPELEDGPARFAVVQAVNPGSTLEPGDEAGDAAAYLRAEYPAAIRHVRLARRAVAATAVLLLIVIGAWRVVTGGEA
jgi:hypothetical protein